MTEPSNMFGSTVIPSLRYHKAADARIEMVPADQPHGGSLYTCCDPEGNLWNFGSYDRWETA